MIKVIEMMNGSSSNKNAQPRMRDCQKDASVQSEERTSQGHAVQWDRFLPFRSIRVLLVENNDSTRLLITALLRNCGYEVVAVRNGKEAWKIIEDQTNDINLVLTEVVTPSLQGVDLLSMIRRHKISKHIPVIMMSSNDCMSTVIKCLSKGAVDFLVKPIRKNELKNLWQHVWRKCGTRRPGAFSSEDEFADIIPDNPSENHETEDWSEPIFKRHRIEGDFSFRPSNYSAFTRYRASTNSQALVGNKEEDDMRSTDNNIYSEREAQHYNKTHNSSEAAEERLVQVQRHHYYYHHHHHVHDNNHELLTGSGNEQNSENYTTYSFSGSGSGNNSNIAAAGGSGDPHQKFQLTQREIALNRFREKRKKRCFDNKL